MTKTFMVDSEVYVAVAGRYRCIRGVDVPAGIDLSKIYGWYEVEGVQTCDTWEGYRTEYDHDGIEADGDEPHIKELEYNFFKKMFDDGTLQCVGHCEDKPVPVNAGYVTVGFCDGSAYAIVCALPLIFDTSY